MLLMLLLSMAVMELLPIFPKPTDLGKKPAWQRPLCAILLPLLELPSSLIALGAAIALEFALLRPFGYRTDTIGDQQRFTAADAYPRPFFMASSNPDYNYDLSSIATWDGVRTIFGQGALLAAVGWYETTYPLSHLVSNY